MGTLLTRDQWGPCWFTISGEPCRLAISGGPCCRVPTLKRHILFMILCHFLPIFYDFLCYLGWILCQFYAICTDTIFLRTKGKRKRLWIDHNVWNFNWNIPAGWPLKLSIEMQVHSSTFSSTFYDFQVHRLRYTVKFQYQKLFLLIVDSGVSLLIPLNTSPYLPLPSDGAPLLITAFSLLITSGERLEV